MKSYVKKYMDFFGYDISDYMQCEIPGCGERAVHVCHINCKGIGGRKSVDNIENLMGMCYAHDIQFGDKKDHKPMLNEVHSNFMALHKPVNRHIASTVYPTPDKDE